MDILIEKNWLLALFFEFLFHFHWASTVSINSTKEATLLSRLLADYDQDVRPLLGISPINVSADILIGSFGIIEEAKMEIPVYFFLRQYWTDERLAGKINHTITFSGAVIEKFWKPDLYCYNARQSNLMIKDDDVNSKLTIKPNGSMDYSRGSTIIASCDMDLRDFPMDTQRCTLTFGSYSLNDKDIIFTWKKNKMTIEQEEMSQFDFVGIKLGKEVKDYEGENYTRIYFTVTLTRRYGYYIIQVYCPDILIVSLSWIILWMDGQEIGERLSLGITTILTVMFLLGSANASMPKVSYAKAIDWYLLVSFAFVFMTLVESMLVFLLGQTDDEKKTPKKKGLRTYCLPDRIPMIFKIKRHSEDFCDAQEQPSELEMDQLDDTAQNNQVSDKKIKKSSRVNKPTFKKKCAENIDKCSRVLFPLAFLFYTITYWLHYESRRK